MHSRIQFSTAIISFFLFFVILPLQARVSAQAAYEVIGDDQINTGGKIM